MKTGFRSISWVMAKAALALLLVVTALATISMAGPLDQRQLPEDIDWVMHLNLDLLRNSDFGQAVHEHLVGIGLNERMASFQQDWGFNPQDSVIGITMFGYGRDCEGTIILLHGVFNQQSIVQSLRTKQDYANTTYRNLSVHNWFSKGACGDEQGRTVYGCMFNNTLIIMSVSAEQVNRTIDVLTSYSSNMASAGGLAQVDALSNGSFLVAAARNIEAHPMLARCDEITMSISQQQDDLHLQTIMLAEDTEAAANICQVLYGMRAFAIMNEDEKPRLAEIARSVNFNCQEQWIEMDMSCPPEIAFEFVTKRWTQMAD